ncbi:MAG: hypothetical protein L0Z53_06805 [Acidobacteriales bacterium]|nr:hypothetical protein [Terriglobales bacterium]
MAYNAFRPKPGRHGVHVVVVSTGNINSLTSAATDNINISTPFRRGYVLSASVFAAVVPVITTGTSTLTLKKRQASDASVKTLSSSFDVETLTLNKASPLTIPSTIAETDKFVRKGTGLASGDILFAEFVNGTTVTTQPTGLQVVVELALLE